MPKRTTLSPDRAYSLPAVVALIQSLAGGVQPI
jgi:hypothetical protein